MENAGLKSRIDAAAGNTPADIVIKNGKIIDVFNGEIIYGDVAIKDGYFVGIGDYTGNKTIDAGGSYISPAFIDGHVHIESSMVTPSEFAKVLLLHGITTAITDPHEIANVSGALGIQFMLDSSENLPFDIYAMLPSSVPATEFEHAGARLEIEELKPFYRHQKVLGLAEVMNFPAVLAGDDSMIKKLVETKNLRKKIDGHAAGLSNKSLNVYGTAFIRTDHEATTAEEAKERLSKGMYLMIREGTVAKNLKELVKVVTEPNSRRCLFVTDDKLLDDLVHEGSIDHNMRLAVAEGISPITAYQMSTINTAECFGIEDKGAIAPGYKADFLIVRDLDTVAISHVFKDGKLVVKNGELVNDLFPSAPIPERLMNSVHFRSLTEDDFDIQLKSHRANIIEIVPNSLVTRHLVEDVPVDGNGSFQISVQKDQLKLAVIERHHMTGNIGLGIVKGLGLKSGAIATTVAHDSHNLIVAGTNDFDMYVAAEEVKKMQGGLIVVENGRKLASLELPISGLLSDRPYKEVYNKLDSINQALNEIGATNDFDPFLTLSFLALPVIPELKLTDMGLFHVSRFEHISIDDSH